MAVSTAAHIKAGQSALVLSIEGGGHMEQQLRAMGLRPGVTVTKTSGQPLRGPVTLRIGSTEFAVGHRMAERIVVEIEP